MVFQSLQANARIVALFRSALPPSEPFLTDHSAIFLIGYLMTLSLSRLYKFDHSCTTLPLDAVPSIC
jgi:hypothetical protein